MAFTTVGTLRGSTFRTWTPFTWKMLPGPLGVSSTPSPLRFPVYVPLKTPCDEMTSFVSESSVDCALAGSASRCSGKSDAVS
jgi:hypothetical protein